ncbi:hypothetical protein [Dickeya fangzhongdai]|uniref:hypothetical protein n=1 Tax=Dickeya fangzhongdai TaxID=1778540 RepID=UPI000675D6FD|nr:hypothetical protein [Dickeya fangzhongdai]WES90361.1 hypothetical protein PQ617_07575 [Dickeya fangzhongdai]
MKYYLNIFALSFLLFFSNSTLAENELCDNSYCEGFPVPDSIKKIAKDGYEKIKSDIILGKKYLMITTGNDINKCSTLFQITATGIKEKPVLPEKNPICNYSINKNNVISSWKDEGKWNEDIYQVSDEKWTLMFRDACVGCGIVKRTYFKEGVATETALLKDESIYTERAPIFGTVSVEKTVLLNSPIMTDRKNSYLIAGDHFKLLDMSDNGEFYKISYQMKSGKILTAWINSDDFSLDEK